MIAAVRRFIAQHDLIPRGSRVVAAVSGGSDSMALAHILRELAEAGTLTLAGLAHVNHQLRPTADRDEAFVRDVAASFGVAFFADRDDVAARARRERSSIEAAARDARYEALARARVAAGADLIALGHTRDDQAETVLLRLIRGAGPRGLAGMHPRRGAVVRPLLTCRRSELRAWLSARGAAFVEDETNADVSIPRNRVRAELLPLLADRFNPSIVDVLADQAELAREAWAWTDSAAAELAAEAARSASDGPQRVLDIETLRAAPVALQRAALWRVMRDISSRRAAFGHIEAARRLMEQDDGASVDAPGHRVERDRGSLVLTGREAGAHGRRVAAPPNLFRYPLSIPGEVVVAGATIAAARGNGSAILGSGGGDSAAGRVAYVRGDLCTGSLAVRNRRPGDRFRPLGLNGRKKLQDYFVDRKIPRGRRDEVPLVVDANDRIVWVAGHQIDDEFRVTDGSQGVVILTFKAVGGSA